MQLTVWDLFKYLYKHKIFIALTVLCSLIAAKLYVASVQTYSAETVIRYKDSCISKGKALDGTAFNTDEIISPKVIANAKKDLPFNITEDKIRSNTKIVPIVPSSEEDMKKAKLDVAEEYEYYPNTFRIVYKGNSSYYETRDTLDRLIDNYFKFYNEKYLYLATVSEIDYSLDSENFDYIEQAEILQNNIDSTISILKSYVSDNEYRSPSNGLTFKDLINEFDYLSEFKLPLIFSRVYAARLSKDKALLINKYTERMEQYGLAGKNASEKSALAEDRMNAYVDANVDVPNSYNTARSGNNDDVAIIQDVHDDFDRRIQEQTTYDSLIKNYVSDSVAANNNTIDAAHCKDVIKIFSTPADKGIDYGSYEQLVRDDIKETLAQLKKLYEKAFSLIDDYNLYVPSQHIESITGIRYYENVYSSFYMLIALIIGFALSCIIVLMIEIMKKYAAFAAVAKADAGSDEILEDAPVIPKVSTDKIDE